VLSVGIKSTADTESLIVNLHNPTKSSCNKNSCIAALHRHTDSPVKGKQFLTSFECLCVVS